MTNNNKMWPKLRKDNKLKINNVFFFDLPLIKFKKKQTMRHFNFVFDKIQINLFNKKLRNKKQNSSNFLIINKLTRNEKIESNKIKNFNKRYSNQIQYVFSSFFSLLNKTSFLHKIKTLQIFTKLHKELYNKNGQ